MFDPANSSIHLNIVYIFLCIARSFAGNYAKAPEHAQGSGEFAGERPHSDLSQKSGTAGLRSENGLFFTHTTGMKHVHQQLTISG
jgi:hypothetical protein